MTASSLAPAAMLHASALRIVLFGMPGAGKSSLLGALAQAAQTQDQTLDGRLIDPLQGLAELQHRLYEGAPRETLDEVVLYAVQFERFAHGTQTGVHIQDVVLVDCDGRAANDLMRAATLDTPGHHRQLAAAVSRADTLVLVMDAAGSRMQPDFEQFAEFLRRFEQNRGRHTDVGGLPVFLVLTKCDLLARPGEPAEDWLDRVEGRKTEVSQAFREFLARQAKISTLSFGNIDLHVWATAIKRPALAGVSERPREPFGVAELFRQCFDQAESFRQRQRRSQRLLRFLAGGTAVVLAALLALGVLLALYRPDTTAADLAERVKLYRLREEHKPAAERLQSPLPPKIATLRRFQQDADFESLSPEDRRFIDERLAEIVNYADLLEALQQIRVGDLRSMTAVDATENRLKHELAPPTAYAAEWAETDALQLHGRLLTNLAELREAVSRAEDWFRHHSERAEELRAFSSNKPHDAPSWEHWLRQAELIGSAVFSGAEETLQFDRVAKAQRDWKMAQQRLEELRALIAALGLAGNLPDGGRQPLDIPAGLSLRDAASHWQVLQRQYPGMAKNFAAPQLPEAVASELRRAAQARYDHLIESGRLFVLQQLQKEATGTTESLDLWRRLQLETAEELLGWRQLAAVLGRVLDNTTPDPVTGLVDFLRRDRFELAIRHATLEIPSETNIRPVGPLTIFHGSRESPVPALVLKLVDEEGRSDPSRQSTAYAFAQESGVPLEYKPGEFLYASLPVKKNDDPGQWMLTWARRRSEVYPFECLERPPRLHRVDQENTEGTLLGKIVLKTFPPDGLPKVPDLVPVVQLRNSKEG
jgi:GTPase SAR1 family protein